MSQYLDIEELAEALKALEDFADKKARWTWCPHKPTKKQRLFESLDAFEAFYGGAAGGGKSDSLLRIGLKHVDVPGFNAILFRRTYRDLALPGALMDRAAEWLRPTAASWNQQEKRWEFPSGAKLCFGYLEAEVDKYRYQSSEFHYIAFDELTHFTETQYRYLLSRARRVEGFHVKPFVRSGSNPGGVGHDWVKERFVDPGHPDRPFVPATLEDNPHLDQASYREALSKLDAVTRAQLEQGLWVRDGAGLIYKLTSKNLCPSAPEPPASPTYVLGVDLGASESKPTTAFVSLLWHPFSETVWVLESEKKAGLSPSDIAMEIRRLSGMYDYSYIIMDEGALGKGYGEEFRRRWAIPVQPAEKRNKLGYRKLLSGAFEHGKVIIAEPDNAQLVEELRTLTWNEQGTDNEKGQDNHLTDALLYAWRACHSYAPRRLEDQPRPGSRAYAEWEEKEMERRELAEYRQEAEKPWWQRH